MGRLNSIQGSTAAFILKVFFGLVRMMPHGAALFVGRCLGDAALILGVRQRRTALGHLKVAFGSTLPYARLRSILREYYRSFGQSICEVARLPLIASRGYASCVDIEGREHLDEAMKQGKGCIFLAIHHGNWELSNVVGSMCGYPYNLVANDLEHINRIADLLDQLRRSSGCRVIHPGIGGREIIRRLQRNEIVTLVADQGGADGISVPFFGRDASMSTGAVRIALKYGTPIILVDIHRMSRGRHRLTATPFPLSATGNDERDLLENLTRMMAHYEAVVRQYPSEYVWLYRTWKYAKDRTVLILDDGRVGHLRQSQAVARAYGEAARERGLSVLERTIVLKFRSPWAARLLPLLAGGRFLFNGVGMDQLGAFLEPACLDELLRLRPDMVISCGARASAVNALVARDNFSRSVAVLPNRLIPSRAFDLVVVHQHDLKDKRLPPNTVVTRGAPNLMDKAYLEECVRGLYLRYQHLRHNARRKMAVLIGGDARELEMSRQDMRIVLHQVKSAAEELGMDILITTSRRTPPSVEQLVWQEFNDHPRTALLIIANRSHVPEAVGGMLGLADLVLVTGESVSMVSEAVSSGKRTIVFPVSSASAKPTLKYARFCDLLARQGHIIYTPVTRVAPAIDSAVRNKIVTRPIKDQAVIVDALRKIIR